MKWRDEFLTRHGVMGLALIALIALLGAVTGLNFWVALGLMGGVAVVASHGR